MGEPVFHPWFQSNWRHLCDLHRRDRLPHALIVHGSRGIGKGQFSTAFAHYLLCHAPVGDKTCGSCRACQLNAVGNHPDLFRLAPEEPGKPIKVMQIRGLTEFICSTAQQGGYRVVIIDPADAMNVSSANALLKMLEEPGNDTLIMLLTDRLGQVMPTIKSRCQRVECPLPNEAEGVAFIADKLSLDSKEAAHILRINNGAPMAALEYKASGLEAWREKLVEGLADVLKRRRTVVDVAASWQKADLEQMLGWFYGLLADASRAQMSGSEVVRHEDAQNMLRALIRKADARKLFALAEKVQEARKSLILRQNTNKQMLLERILLEWSAILR